MKTQTFKLNYSVQDAESGVGVVLPAAGNSNRMGEIDKIFAEIKGVPTIVRTLTAFEKHPQVCSVVVVTKPENILKMQQLVLKYGLNKVTDIIAGGKERCDSVRLGFERLTADKNITTVLVHDGARPLVSQDTISRVIDAVKQYGAAAAAVPVKDAIKTVGENGAIGKNIDRKTIMAMQTPQGFTVENYRTALQKIANSAQNFADECEVLEQAGVTVYTVAGNYQNIKITTPEDLFIAGAFLEE